MPSNLIFNIENAVFISGAEPTFGHTGSCFHISGSGMHDVTGLRFSDTIGNKIQLDFSTGLIGAVQTVTGCVPEMEPQDLLTIEAYNSISTGTYKYFEVGEENCVNKCNVEITGTLSIGNIPYDASTTGFLTVDFADNNKINFRGIDVDGITGFDSTATILTAGSGLVGGGDVSASRRFDVVGGTGIVVDEDSVNVDSGQLLVSGQGFFNVNKKGLTGDTSVYFLNGESLDLGVGEGTGIIVNQNSVDINTGLVITTGDAFFNINASLGLTGDSSKVYLGDSLDFGVGAGTGIITDADKVHVNSGQVVLTSGNQTITGVKTFSQIEVVNLLRASGSGIIVNNLHVTESITGDGNAAKVLTENAVYACGLTFSNKVFTTASVSANNNGEVALSNLTQNVGVEICTIDFAARQSGNIINVESELSFSAVDVVDLYIMLFVDDETSPRRVWQQQIYTATLGAIFQGMFFFSDTDTNSHTYKLRVVRAYNRGSRGRFYINRYYGSLSASSILIQEIEPQDGAGIGSI